MRDREGQVFCVVCEEVLPPKRKKKKLRSVSTSLCLSSVSSFLLPLKEEEEVQEEKLCGAVCSLPLSLSVSFLSALSRAVWKSEREGRRTDNSAPKRRGGHVSRHSTNTLQHIIYTHLYIYIDICIYMYTYMHQVSLLVASIELRMGTGVEVGWEKGVCPASRSGPCQMVQQVCVGVRSRRGR